MLSDIAQEYSKFRDDFDELAECRFYEEDNDAANFLAEFRASGFNRLDCILNLVEHQKKTISDLRWTNRWKLKAVKLNRVILGITLAEAVIIVALVTYIAKELI